MFISSANQIAATGKMVKFSLDAFVVSSATATFAADIGAMKATTKWWDGPSWNILLGQKGTLTYYDGVGGYAVNGDYGYHDVGTFGTDKWVSFEVVADYSTHTFDATVDGFSWSGNFRSGNADNFGLFFAACNREVSSYFIDNVSVQIIPEPSAIIMLVTGMIGLICCGWRKRR